MSSWLLLVLNAAPSVALASATGVAGANSNVILICTSLSLLVAGCAGAFGTIYSAKAKADTERSRALAEIEKSKDGTFRSRSEELEGRYKDCAEDRDRLRSDFDRERREREQERVAYESIAKRVEERMSRLATSHDAEMAEVRSDLDRCRRELSRSKAELDRLRAGPGGAEKS